MRRATRRATIAAAAFFAPASALLAPGLPQLDLFLDMRMTIRNPTDALEAIKSTPDGLIMWESPVAPDWGDALDGLDVLAVDPGSRNVEGLPAVRKGRDVALFEPPFDAETPVSGREPTARCLQDAVRNVERLVATPRLPRGYSGRAGRGDAAGAERRRVAATPRLARGYSVEANRGCDVEVLSTPLARLRYSRNLNHLWATGGVVLLWDEPIVEWYYPLLQTGVTHLVVNRSTAAAVVDRLEANPAEYKRLAAGAARIANYVMSAEGMANYLDHVLEAVRRHVRYDLVLDDRRALLELLESWGACKRLVEWKVTSRKVEMKRPSGPERKVWDVVQKARNICETLRGM